jgi:hypothetical protein
MDTLDFKLTPLKKATQECFIDTCNEDAMFNVETVEGDEVDQEFICGPHTITLVCGGIVMYVTDISSGFGR